MKSATKKRGTATSAFGSPGRVGHDSTKFYESRLYEGHKVPKTASYVESPIDPSILDRIYCKSSEAMEEIPDYSIHLMVTSPPYNVTKEYDEDLTLDEYRELLNRVFRETYRVLVTGGRACINIANLGRKPYIPLHSYIIQDTLEIGFLMRGEIIWNKAAGSGSSTAWGSFQSASNPTLRDIHEYTLVFSKESFGRKKRKDKDTISKREFLDLTKSVWTFSAESARRVGHPAPFPVELPYRLTQLHTFKDEVVLDPFCGSGSTCLAAMKTDRHYVGYEIRHEYVEFAQQRIKAETQQLRLVLPGELEADVRPSRPEEIE